MGSKKRHKRAQRVETGDLPPGAPTRPEPGRARRPALLAALAVLVLAAVVLLVWHLASSPQRGQGTHRTSPPAEPAHRTRAPQFEPQVSPHMAARPELQALYANLRAEIAAQPEQTLGLHQLAALLLEADEPLAARQTLAQAPKAAADDELALGLTAAAELRLGRLDRALAAYRRLVARSPRAWSGWYYLGVVQQRLGRFAEAERSFAEAARRNPRVYWPQEGLGLVRLEQGRAAEALQALDRAAELAPDQPAILPHRMHALLALGEQERALELYDEYLRRHTRGTIKQPFATRPPLAAAQAPESAGLRFTDVAPALKLDAAGRGRAAAWADVDGDGHLDLLVGRLGRVSRLWRSRSGPGAFEEVTEQAGLGFFDDAVGLAAGDLDNDGDLDLYVARSGQHNEHPLRSANVLLRNRGQGVFEDATTQTGGGDPGAGRGVVLSDFDRDGLLDLFVVNEGDATRLLHNRGAGRFDDVSEQAGVARVARSISAVAADFDDDGDPDLFVANNGEENLLYRNDTPPGGRLSFAEVGFASRVALSGGYGCTVADFDNDGRLDLFVANLNNWDGGSRFTPGDPSYLFLNQGGLTFSEAALASGLAYVGGATAPVAADLDADGWVDLYLGTGGPEPRRDEPDVLYRNLGKRPGGGVRFAEVTRAAGVHRPSLSGKGVVVGDYDEDGDLDLYVPSGDLLGSDIGHAALWRNDTPQGHRVMLRLVGTSSNRSAIGARATLRSGDLQRVAEVIGNTGCGGQQSLDLVFGLGPREQADTLTIRWPAGGRTTLDQIPVDRLLIVTEGERGFEAR